MESLTRQNRLSRAGLVLGLYIGAYALSLLLQSIASGQGIDWLKNVFKSNLIAPQVSMTIVLNLLACFVVFPVGFGFQKFDGLAFLPHLAYFVLGVTITIANTNKTFRSALLLFIFLLAVNVYGCSFTPHHYTW